MKKITLIALLFGLPMLAAHAEQAISWKINGMEQTAFQVDPSHDAVQARGNETEQPVQIKLSTGQTVTLTGEIYVETDNYAAFWQYVNTNGLNAEPHAWAEHGFTINLAPEEVIAALAGLAEQPFITTAEPTFLRKVVKK